MILICLKLPSLKYILKYSGYFWLSKSLNKQTYIYIGQYTLNKQHFIQFRLPLVLRNKCEKPGFINNYKQYLAIVNQRAE